MKRKILVTGSSGFLGNKLSVRLKHAGYKLITFDYRDGQDIMNYKQVRDSLKGCSVCIHLAAIADLYIAEDNPLECKRINVDGTAVIAKACKEEDVLLLYGSTCCIYGNNNQEISSETSPVSPTELYAETKLQGEAAIIDSGCSYKILRLATFYGPQMRASLATDVFISNIINSQPVKIHGDGNQTRCYTHVDDIVSGIITVLEHPDSHDLFNIASDEACSVNQLIDVIEEILDTKVPRIHVAERVGQILSSDIDSTRLRTLGWSPQFSIIGGMKDCIACKIGDEDDSKQKLRVN